MQLVLFSGPIVWSGMSVKEEIEKDEEAGIQKVIYFLEILVFVLV